VLALGVLAVASVANAEPTAPELQAEGEQLAKDSRFSEAIDKFKAADKIQPTASHACLIALAYTRRELWPQAEIFLARCHERATPQDPLPDWVPVAEQQIAERLATANVAPVTIDVSPPNAKVQLTVSSFAPDETFAPRTIHLPPGRHIIIAEAQGYKPARQEVVIETKDPKRVTIVLEAKITYFSEPVYDIRPFTQPIGALPSPWPKRLIVGGLVLGGAGLVATGLMSYEYFAAKSSAADWDTHIDTYRTSRIAAISLLAIGGGLAITGYLLHRTGESAAVAAAPLPEGGAMIAVGWSR
jgi:hypothetical protein